MNLTRKKNIKCLDFNSSSIGWKLKNGSLGIFKIDALLKEKKSDQINYLANTVMAGNVYSKSFLPISPNYNFQWLTNGSKQVVYRYFSNNRIKIDEKKNNKIDKFFINTKYQKKIEVSIESLIDNYELFNESLSCKLEFNKQIIEFPIKHINVQPLKKKFQIETGPIIFKRNNKFISAFIFFNSCNKCQIVWYYPKLGGKIEELEVILKYFINA